MAYFTLRNTLLKYHHPTIARRGASGAASSVTCNSPPSPALIASLSLSLSLSLFRHLSPPLFSRFFPLFLSLLSHCDFFCLTLGSAATRGGGEAVETCGFSVYTLRLSSDADYADLYDKLFSFHQVVYLTNPSSL